MKTRKKSPDRFRKKPILTKTDHDSISGQLRQIRDAIGKKDYTAGLSLADRLLATESRPVQQAQILCFAGDSEFQQGKFSQAFEIYGKARSLSGNEGGYWFRPVLGQVNCLLNEVRVEEALNLARETISRAVELERQFASWIKQVDSQVRRRGTAFVPVRPLRTSVVASRLGKAFFQQGELELARECFEKALEFNPQGSCRARIGLGWITLRNHDPEAALKWTQEALECGQYRAKTLGAWPLLILAWHQAQRGPFDVSLVKGLAQATPAIRARAVYLICEGLRNVNDSHWKGVARDWLAQEGDHHPLQAAEVRKLELCDSKLFAVSVEEQMAKSQALLELRPLGPMEWMTAAKTWLKASLAFGQEPNVWGLLEQSAQRFPNNPLAAAKHRHGLARAYFEVKKYDAAFPLLQQNMSRLPSDSRMWRQAVYLLAKLEIERGNFLQAAGLYQRFYQQTGQPLSFRLYALIQWARTLIQSGSVESVLEAKGHLLSAIEQIQDYEVVLNLAQQLVYAPAELNQVATEIFERGEKLALKMLAETSNPAGASTLLFKLARRQADFGRYVTSLELWESFSEQKRSWLWSERNDFWEYLSLIFQAYRQTNRLSQAQKLAETYLNDSATPAHGRAMLGTLYGLSFIQQKRLSQALGIFKQITLDHPNHLLCAYAYYWLALNAWKQADLLQAQTLSDHLLRCTGTTPGLNEFKNLAMKGLCLKADLDLKKIPVQTAYSSEQLENNLLVIQRDLEKF